MNSTPSTIALGELTTLISSGATPKGGSETYLDQGPVMFIRSQNVRMNKLNLGDVAYITEAVDSSLKRTRVQRGDVLLNITGASIGRVAPFTMETRANVNQHVCVIRPEPRALEQRYLAHLMATPEFQSEIDRLQHGGTRQALTFSQIASFPIPLRPLREQQRIADVLDRAEALRARRRAALAQLDTLTQAVFLDHFGDPVENRRRLPTAKLEGICRRITDGTHQSPKWTGSGVPFLFISNIVDGEIDFDTDKFISAETHSELTRRCPIETGDILYTTVGSYGNVAVVKNTRKFAFQRHIAHLKPDLRKAEPAFLAAMLASPGVRRQVDAAARGIAQKTVNLASLRALLVFDVPLGRQQEFAVTTSAIEKLRGAQRSSLTELDALFASLQHRAFRGEL